MTRSSLVVVRETKLRYPPAMTTELDDLRRERDLLLRLLELSSKAEVGEVLATALTLMTEISGAKRGYIELRFPDAPPESPPRWTALHALTNDEAGAVHAFVSRGIVAETLRQGRTVQTAAASRDPRFDARESVRRHAIQAVLCVPLGSTPPAGVLYLEGTERGGPFRPEIRHLAELFADQISPVIDRLLSHAEAREDPAQVFQERLDIDDLIGRSPAFIAMLHQLSLVAPLDVTVLITGPSGSGKTQLARAIARNSARASRPFLDINCAALPDELIESELFGARRGAHSTATRDTKGKIAAAEGGTLLLDEIGELSLRSQAKILQLIQDKTYFPLGATAPVTANIRILAATKLDLRARVEEKRFREDLYYRLKVLPLAVPSLSEREEDIPALVRHFAREAADRMKLPHPSVSEVALAAARAATWPGEIRQLAHAVEAAVVRARGEGSSVIKRHHIFPPRSEDTPPRETTFLSFQEATARFQRELVTKTLAATKWNISESARRLELTRTHIYNLIKAYGLERD